MDNLWTRRSSNNKLSLSTGGQNPTTAPTSHDLSSRSFSFGRRQGDSSLPSSKNIFHNVSSSSSSIASPTGASSAFGLGSGAFASFGSSKNSKTTGNTLDFSNIVSSSKTSSTELGDLDTKHSKLISSDQKNCAPHSSSPSHLLRHNWVVWFRPPAVKSNGYIQYEKTLHPVAGFGNVEDFLRVYRHLKRPSTLPPVSDYHIFKKGIRPVWEDNENRKGGKWIVRLKKGVADRYWEDLIFAIIGDQFAEASEEVCGAVLSVRNGEDILSIWTKNDGGRVLKIRESMKRILGFPPDTRIEWKSHDSSIQQRTAIEEHRKEKLNHHNSNIGRSSNRAQESLTSPLPDKN